MTFDFSYSLTYLPVLLKGAVVTLQITAITLVISTIAGLLLALMRVSSNNFLKYTAGTYVWVFRGIPQLLVLFFV